MDEDSYSLIDAAPEVEEYLLLRSRAGLSPRNAEQAAGALAGSWAWCHVRHRCTGAAVAMGRVLGDGGWYFHLADIATLPEHQRRGLGRRVLGRLLAMIDERAPADPYVTLLADAPGRPLYRRLGFAETAPTSVGMVLVGRR